jgi:hypothetical protein
MMRPAPLLALLLLTLAPAAQARGQVVLMDEGTFSLFLGGERVGREDFSIRATPGPAGSAYVAQGNVLLGDTRTSVSLNADSAGLPLRYRLETRIGGEVTETIAGESRRSLWMGRAFRADGESAREFRLPPGAIAVEDGVVHHLWFVVREGPGATPRLLSPRTLALRQVRVEDAGPDRVALGLREFVTRRWTIRAMDATPILYEVWTDLRGRMLKVRLPAQDLEAIRDEPPTETPGE